ncbi:hypothetical protein MJO28_003505 [Puccinia striiformis f. sp. tritici]|uniref:Uncharacterized protein n=1 Tax=Puccinia striiformis f. sp. tritici TaxID=168172 RepID=A0ACC0ETH0_9BASI|nr:hypothetical protein MJO28_003505 [Puccinia striiformis f. sp. tritici]
MPAETQLADQRERRIGMEKLEGLRDIHPGARPTDVTKPPRAICDNLTDWLCFQEGIWNLHAI